MLTPACSKTFKALFIILSLIDTDLPQWKANQLMSKFQTSIPTPGHLSKNTSGEGTLVLANSCCIAQMYGQI